MGFKYIIVAICLINIISSTTTTTTTVAATTTTTAAPVVASDCPGANINAISGEPSSQVTYTSLSNNTEQTINCNANYTGTVTVQCLTNVPSVKTQNCVRKVCPAGYINSNNNWIAYDQINAGVTSVVTCPSGSSGSLELKCNSDLSVTVENNSGCTASQICSAGCIAVNGALACWSGNITNDGSAPADCNGDFVGNPTVTCTNGVPTATGTCAAPSCTDGIKNQNETSVDCGGSCTACSNSTTAHPSEESEATDSGPAILACIVLMIIVSILCCGTFWYFYTHKDLANAVTRRLAARKESKGEKLDNYNRQYDVEDSDN